ncbi:MAG: hypothetical protein NWE89_01945 [Candidatus Bathyarchaeota archaeon]|nr:hypothetical protein [Candidatus Bathyarchaeota archaeon]
MNYQMVLLAHGAFYKYETRANHYDTFMANKNPELWASPDLADDEISNLFKFVRRWDRFFTGQQDLFQTTFSDNFKEIQFLSKGKFYDLDIENEDVQSCIQNIFNAFATCNRSGNYESTGASKLAHAMNPDVFVMWDSNIRGGYFGSKEEKSAERYAFEFLPLMKNKLHELLDTCTEESNLTEKESLDLLEKITGNSVPKLIDQFNYMTFTMPTMFKTYLGNISTEEKERISFPFGESIQYWRSKVSTRTHRDRKRTGKYVEMINELRRTGAITAKERKEYDRKWRINTDDRDYWFNEVAQLLKKSRS